MSEGLGADAQVQHLRAEIERIIAEAQAQAGQARWWSSFWRVAHIVLGLPAVVLATLSGATGLSSADARIPAAVLALAAAALTAGAGFLRSDARASASRARKNAWWQLEAEARMVLARDGYGQAAPLVEGLRHLLDQRKAALDAGGDDASPAEENQTA
ncbi:hypothetical protein [Nonomuraea typhae]|uniref:hypothetical protein n=1 Tax=Nonomuraea typhae TaxID=2603600 RepID=UPI0012FA2EBA|nr:hypothetical protein [Nonomuraea typhae]